ncbi:hypothetical protein LC087_04435 [Bacillus carboniphilus]|uniref:Uncharacterized protein n=1 Tax=Bacillus carboniphilus TaxID=86663 RepID=A0ABY9JY19_9BACI|nr:hypothetical protein [Bacillus carboniphilus]WLR43427.1 hypothetical protein LC087_04435 [Bacillus carboniphilus]
MILESTLLMGGIFREKEFTEQYSKEYRIDVLNINQKLFRPSCFPALNNHQFTSDFFHFYDEGKTNRLMRSAENSLLNYYSILREAAFFSKGVFGGCGTIGNSTLPYPIAYQFLTKDYQKRVTYDDFLLSFLNIGHIHLIKLIKVDYSVNSENEHRFFVELETIEGSKKNLTYFGYYYGFITIKVENDLFKIDDIVLYGEDFLCSPYHGWDYIGEAIVDVKYGKWCNLVRTRYPTIKHTYVKYIYFLGTDEQKYVFIFFELTNGTDIEIAQFKVDLYGGWVPIQIDPSKCLK